MRACRCPTDELDKRPVRDARGYELVLVDELVDRARIFPGTGRIELDRAWWARLDKVQRDAVLAHELAHEDDPRTCEACTDARAGARMRWGGYGAEQTAAALGSVVRHRRAAAHALEGWRAADAAIRSGAGATLRKMPPAAELAARDVAFRSLAPRACCGSCAVGGPCSLDGGASAVALRLAVVLVGLYVFTR